MEFTTHRHKRKLKLVIFDLPAVIDYRKEDLRPLLQEAIEENLGQKVSMEFLRWEENCSGVLLDVFKRIAERFPTNEEFEAIKSSFNIKLRSHFMKRENLYDVRHGVQSILMQLQTLPDWHYCIVSDYWQEPTPFILESCGIYRKNIDLYTADDALSSQDLVNKVILKRQVNKSFREIFLISDQASLPVTSRQPVHFISLKMLSRNALNHFAYPKFADLFKRVERLPRVN